MNAFTSRAWTSLEARLLSRPPVVHSTTRQVCGIGISNGKATGGFVYCQCPLVCSIESQSRRKCATQAVTGKMYTTFAWKLFLSFFPNTISFLPDNAKWERKSSLWLSTLLEAATANIIVASLTIVWKGIPIVLLLAQNITRSLGGTRSRFLQEAQSLRRRSRVWITNYSFLFFGNTWLYTRKVRTLVRNTASSNWSTFSVTSPVQVLIPECFVVYSLGHHLHIYSFLFSSKLIQECWAVSTVAGNFPRQLAISERILTIIWKRGKNW